MSDSRVLDEIFDKLFERVFGTKDVFGREGKHFLYDKFIAKDGVYDFVDGEFVKIFDNEEVNKKIVETYKR